MKQVTVPVTECRSCRHTRALVEDVARTAGVPRRAHVEGWFRESPTP